MSRNGSSPLVSAVVTTYDRPDRCKRAVESVTAQTYDAVELIVVEDGTHTGIETWLAENVPEATYVRHQNNRGLSAARNTGLQRATGEYVAYLDDDDIWKPERLEQQITAVRELSPGEHRTVGVIYCGVERRTEAGRTVSIGLPENEGDLEASIREVGASTLPSTCLFRREALLDVGGFDESLPSSIDHDIWMSLATAGYRAVTVEDPLVVTYISHSGTMVSDTRSRIAGVRQYVEKWTPTYQSWFGVEAGNRYGERYFADVIARLVAANVVAGRFGEAFHATRAVFGYSSQYRYNVAVITRTVLRRVVSHTLPPPAVDLLRRIRERLSATDRR